MKDYIGRILKFFFINLEKRDFHNAFGHKDVNNLDKLLRFFDKIRFVPRTTTDNNTNNFKRIFNTFSVYQLFEYKFYLVGVTLIN